MIQIILDGPVNEAKTETMANVEDEAVTIKNYYDYDCEWPVNINMTMTVTLCVVFES